MGYINECINAARIQAKLAAGSRQAKPGPRLQPGGIMPPNLPYALKIVRRTIDDIAVLFRCSHGQAYKKLTGRAVITPEEQLLLARELGFDPVWLFRPARPRYLKRTQEQQAASYY